MTGQVQILGIRENMGANAFFNEKWRANSVQDLFNNIEEIIENIPEQDRWNLYFTVAECHETKGRKIVRQSVIPIDIDGIDVDHLYKYAPVVLEALKLDPTKTAVVFSGNGLQMFIQTNTEWTLDEHIHRYKPQYNILCSTINTAIKTAGLVGHADPVVWSPARLMRMPNTLNVKPDKPQRMASIIQGNLEPVEWEWDSVLDIGSLSDWGETSVVHPEAANKFSKPDVQAIEKGCGFISYCKTNQSVVSEPQWYAMLSLVGRFDDDGAIAHDYSVGHSDYNPDKTSLKVEQALSKGPRLCSSIEPLYDGCKACPHFGKISTPLQIKSDDFIATEDTGFREVTIKDGKPQIGKFKHHDLVKYYLRDNHFICTEDGILYTWEDKYWQGTTPLLVKAFVDRNVADVKDMDRKEYLTTLKSKRVAKNVEFKVPNELINCNNGIVDIHTQEIMPSSPDYKFKYVLPFDYDPQAVCPKWEQFLKEVTLDRQELIDVLQEFIGYTLSYDDPVLGQKGLILYGGGQNGKSVVLDIIKELVGHDNHANIDMTKNRPEDIDVINDKVALIRDEISKSFFRTPETFKLLTTGGSIQARKMYIGPYSTKFLGKVILACNELPPSSEQAEGLKRRLIVVPFDYRVPKSKINRNIVNDLKEELPGIFNWAVSGYKRLVDNKYLFTDSEIVNKTVREASLTDNFAYEFIDDACEVADEEAFVSTEFLYESWQEATTLRNKSNISKAQFSKAVAHVMRVLKDDHTYSSTTKRISNKAVRGYKGITVIPREENY